jgi:ubiquinone/menaquinone biosynthesis C-methylase UbiE
MDYLNCLLALATGTPRQGPGTDEATRRALGMVRVPTGPHILDVGCGSGAQTLVLLEVPGARVTAIDLFAIFLGTLAGKARDRGMEDRLAVVRADMTALPCADGRFDLIWSEGAIYIMGFEAGLRAWRRLLRPGGFLVVSELTYFRPEPPDALRAFWSQSYPGMGDVAGNLRAAHACGYSVVGTFPLEAQGWRDYYAPLARNLPAFGEAHGDDPMARQVIEETNEEIRLFERYADWYGYVFYVLEKL